MCLFLEAQNNNLKYEEKKKSHLKLMGNNIAHRKKKNRAPSDYNSESHNEKKKITNVDITK